ncbi:unnamed protein product [Dicrocoelium dendriticum]|nr:unnamed protein product [Dicrocoelium dendriticum]
MRYTSKDLGNTDSLVTLVDLILEIFSRSISTTPLHNWDAGRQCSALQGLQTLLLLFRHHWLCAKTDRVLLVDGFQRLSELCSSIRTGLFQMLYTDSLPSVANLANRHQRLSSIGWKMDLLNSTFQFGLDMVDWSVGTPPESLLRMLSICFDSMFFQSVRWPNQDSWYTFLTRLLELSSCVGLWNESTNQLQNVLWSTVYPSLKEYTSIDSVECSSTPRHVSRALATIALAFVELSCFGSSVKSTDFTTSIPTPLTIIEHFSTSAAVTHALRFAFIESLFSCTGPLERILLSITRDQTTVTDIAWHFTVLRLAYCLLVRPALDDHGSNQLNSSETPLTCTTSWLAYFPPEFSSFLTTDPELALMALTAKFDGFQTFQERMAYKTLLCDRLGPLCSLLCDLCSVSTVAKERGSGLYHCLVPGLQQDALCTIGYRAVSLIVRHCSRLIYSPFTSGSAASSLELFIANFLLPRQLYEWEKSRWSGLDQMPLPTFVIDCMCDRLTDFIVGLAQLPWRSDSYISRVLKDTVKLYHTHLGSECLATAILNSPVTEFRARLLYLAMAESVNELSDDQVTVQKTKHAFTKWLQLCKLIHNGTRSLETHQRDAPYVVAPILLALSTKTSSTDGLRNDCNAIVNEYKQAINEISSVEMKLQLKEDCRTIAQNYKSIPDLHKFFGI